ncbi:hypothetical protein GCM10022408_31460 [Hymenobacter fastidiosus]|uniref:Secretion system C-terminal sorting domain-containing protein n=2 Tax=Hymenobacter fastidiosus TaxID=486264 RepID=A0ABP7SSJ3_9BACT
MICACLSWLPTQAQNWRPFRPNGDVHAFHGASTDTVLTLRLDSAAVQGADSVYYFNRIMRRTGSFGWSKAVNNQFGQQLRYNVAQRTYSLLFEYSTNNFQLQQVIVLKPFVPVGTTWQSVDIDVIIPTTLLSRGTVQIDGVSDSVATFRVGNSQNIVLSKHYGLVSAPQNLRMRDPAAKILTLARRPDAAGRSYYNPLIILDLQPGDALGYRREAFSFTPFSCYTSFILRRVLNRQLTADSVIYTFQEQSRTAFSTAPGCPGGSPVVSPVSVVRVAAGRRTGQWQSQGAIPYAGIDLLAYEYRGGQLSSTAVLMGHPVIPAQAGTACSGPAKLRQQMLYRSNSAPGGYRPGIDALTWERRVADGVGSLGQSEFALAYVSRMLNGTVQACGSGTDFATLLPAKAASGVAFFQLYPNPATASATLQLPAPARAATTIRLLDNLGRTVRTQPLAAGQTTAILPLQDLIIGLYMVEVQAAGGAAQHLRLQHQ